MHWYVLRSKLNKEEIILWVEVVARGYKAFHPGVRVQPANPKSRKVRPYFPGYLFVQAKLALVGQAVFSWLSFSRGLVTFGGEPTEVPGPVAQAIFRSVDEINANGGEKLMGPEPGDKVTIQNGPFAGYQGILDARVSRDERVRVLLTLLQVNQIKLELPVGQIQRINGS
jgi:transcription antitermination factor NusG